MAEQTRNKLLRIFSQKMDIILVPFSTEMLVASGIETPLTNNGDITISSILLTSLSKTKQIHSNTV